MTRLLGRVPDEVTRFLDNWKLWMGIAYVGLAIAVVWLFILNGDTTRTAAANARDEAVRIAEVQTSAETSYNQCVGSIPTLRKLSTYLEGQNEIAAVIVTNSAANLAITLKTDPMYATRKGNLERLRDAKAKVGAITSLPVPTVKDCKARKRAALAKSSA